MKLYVEEEGSDIVERQVQDAALVTTCWIAYAEACAAFARRLSAAERRQAREGLDEDWSRYVKIEVTEDLLRTAADVAEAYRLRAYDAVHLAAARVVRTRGREPITVASWDHDLEAAAERDGFALLGRRRPDR